MARIHILHVEIAVNNDPIDMNVVSAYLAAYSVTSVRDAATRILKMVDRRLTGKVESAVEQYLNWSIGKYTFAKTFLTPMRKRPLSDVYVHVPLKIHDRVIDEPHALDFTAESNTRAIIVGRAGSGKTTLLQQLVATAVAEGNKIPVLIRLRDLYGAAKSDESQSSSIYSHVKSLFMNSGAQIEDGELHELFNDGRFLFLLDGLDEIPPEGHKRIRSLLNEFLRYHYNDFVLTSRPGESFREWTEWDNYDVQGIAAESAAQLVGHSEYGDDLNRLESFLRMLDADLYRSHYEFASNPLLLSLMYMSFYAHGDIPKKRYSFYSKAFAVLWDKHDASKDGMRPRHRYSGIVDEGQFLRLLEDFSIQAQLQSSFEFDPQMFSLYAGRARDAQRLRFDDSALQRDLIEGLSLMIEDGLVVRFVHRSFQEYFSALYLKRVQAEQRRELGPTLLDRANQDQVLQLLGESNPEYLERDILLPAIAQFYSMHVGLDGDIDYKQYLAATLTDVCLREGKIRVSVREEFDALVRYVQGYLGIDAGVPAVVANRRLRDQPRTEQMKLLLEEISFREYATRDAREMLERSVGSPVEISRDAFVELVSSADFENSMHQLGVTLTRKWLRGAWAALRRLETQCRDREERNRRLIRDVDLDRIIDR